MFPIFGQTWLTGPLKKCNCVICKVCQKTLRQECPPATAQRRKHEDHAHTRASSFVWTLPLTDTIVMGEQRENERKKTFLDFLRVSNSSEFKSLSLYKCSEAPESNTNRVLALPKLREENRTCLWFFFMDNRHPLPIPKRLCERIFLVSRFRLVFFPQISELLDIAPEFHTLE